MDQPILMNAYVNEGTERLQHLVTVPSSLMPGSRSEMFVDPFLEGGCLELRAWVASGLLELLDDIPNGGKPEVSGYKFAWVDILKAIGIAHDVPEIPTAIRDNTLGDLVGFRVDG